MGLEADKKTIFSVGYWEVERFIEEVYGTEYEIMPMEEVGSSQYAATYTMHGRKRELDKYDEIGMKSLVDGNPETFLLSTIFADLTNKGLIEEGEYIIDVNW